jgi:ABC-type glycerol-3-phosphate transport system substrate-binding protein
MWRTTMNKKLVILLLILAVTLMTSVTMMAQSDGVTLEFSQWWEPELPA